jgi:hypothetical protein
MSHRGGRALSKLSVQLPKERGPGINHGARILSVLWSIFCWSVAFGSIFVIYALRHH